jgi:hypothetical protein
LSAVAKREGGSTVRACTSTFVFAVSHHLTKGGEENGSEKEKEKREENG